MMYAFILMLLPAMVFISGCKGDPASVGTQDENVFSEIYRKMTYEKAFYFDESVEKARKYVLENLKELTEEGIHEVKFTKPIIYQKKLFSRGQGRESSRRDISETCIVWKMPGDGKNSIVVFGVGQSRLDDWYPVRVVIKPFDIPEETVSLEKAPEKEKEKEARKKKKEPEDK